MFNRRNRYRGITGYLLWFATALASAFPTVWLVRYASDYFAKMPVHFAPATLSVTVPERAVRAIPLRLVNDSSKDALVTHIQGSCGCQELTTDCGSALALPLRLGPRESVSLWMQVDASGQSGAIEAVVAATIDLGGRRGIAMHKTSVLVQPDLHIAPDHIYVDDAADGQTVEREIVISGRLARILCESPNEIRLESSDGVRVVLRDHRDRCGGDATSDAGFTARLAISFEVAENGFHGWVRASLPGEETRLLYIPIIARSKEMPLRDAKLYPPAIVIAMCAKGSVVNRTVRYDAGAGRGINDVQLGVVPRFVQAAIEAEGCPSDGIWLISLTIETPLTVLNDHEFIVLVDGAGAEVARVPVLIF